MYQLNCSSNNEGVQTFKMGSGNLGLYVIYEECAQKWSVLFRMCDLSLLHHVLNWCQLELKISSTTAQHGTIVPHSPGESPIRKNMYFCRGQSDISHRSAWQFARWYRALSRAWVGFSTFSGDMLGVSKLGKKWYLLDNLSSMYSFDELNYVIQFCTHSWPCQRCHSWLGIVYCAYTRGRRRHRRWLTCDKLRRSSKWWLGVTISDQPDICRESRVSHTHTCIRRRR